MPPKGKLSRLPEQHLKLPRRSRFASSTLSATPARPNNSSTWITVGARARKALRSTKRPAIPTSNVALPATTRYDWTVWHGRAPVASLCERRTPAIKGRRYRLIHVHAFTGSGGVSSLWQGEPADDAPVLLIFFELIHGATPPSFLSRLSSSLAAAAALHPPRPRPPAAHA